jgi:hypothetical protein
MAAGKKKKVKARGKSEMRVEIIKARRNRSKEEERLV